VSGTGFVIDGQRVLTNAHVIEYSSQIYLQPNKSSDKVEATVIVSAPEIDLALLSVSDPTFFERRPAIPMADALPQLNTPVNVYGYPIGGEQISVTKGVISRIDFTRFPQGAVGLRMQIDAALNPGNSGGPALTDGKVVGVAFQVMQGAENIGYVIPVEEVNTFLEDVHDGKYDGKPQLYCEMQTVENEALRSKLKLPQGIGGALVNRLSRELENSPLQVGDVVTNIGEYTLDQTGRVKVSDDLTLPFTYLIPRLSQDDSVQLKIFRAGQSLDVDVPTSRRESQLIPSLRGAYPRYFIVGPLVFTSATREFIAGAGSRMANLFVTRDSPLIDRVTDQCTFDGEELVVVAAPMFSHKITKGLGQPFGAVLRSVNGTQVKNLSHLVELLRDSSDEFLEFEFADRLIGKIVFRRRELLNATDEILSDNGIRKQFSDDLAKVWEKQ
jgi:S1-C subfamily serine protease